MTKTMTKKAQKNGLHQTRIDLSSKVRQELVELLNQSLADTLDLQMQVKQAHWNVKGPQFYQLHLLFDEIASELLEHADEQAERITTLGGTALGTARMTAAASRIDEYPASAMDGIEHITLLSERFSEYCRFIRESIDSSTEIGDLDTADLYTGISRNADKRLWFLEAHLQANH